jgi:hypothetical protein
MLVNAESWIASASSSSPEPITPLPRRRRSPPRPTDGPRFAGAAPTSSTNDEIRPTELARCRSSARAHKQVTRAELRPEQREDVGPRDGIETEVVTESEHGAALPGHDGESVLEPALDD